MSNSKLMYYVLLGLISNYDSDFIPCIDEVFHQYAVSYAQLTYIEP